MFFVLGFYQKKNVSIEHFKAFLEKLFFKGNCQKNEEISHNNGLAKRFLTPFQTKQFFFTAANRWNFM